MRNDSVFVVVGLGNITRRHRRNLRLLFPMCTIIAVSASGRMPVDGSITDADIVTNNLDEAIRRAPDFAIVASPAVSHAEHTIKLINSGIPVLVEKPVVADSQQAEALIKACSDTNARVAVAYCLRYLSSARAVKRILEDEEIGIVFNAQVSIGQYLPDWRPGTDYRNSVSARKELGGGVLLELSHEFDYLHWLLGPQSVRFACLRRSSELALEVEEFADVVLENRQGAISTVHLDFLQRSAMRRCTLIGSSARLEWDLIGNSVQLFDCSGKTVVLDEPTWDKNNMYLDMIRDFIEMIEGRTNNCVGLDDALRTVLLVEKIRANALWGRSQ